MEDGLRFENGNLVYYKHGHPYHAGVIQAEDKIYYIGKGGIAVKGQHIVHSEMANGILKSGTYTFDEDGILVEGSYIPPRKKRSRRSSRKKRPRSGIRLNKKTRKRLWSIAAAVSVLIACVTGIALWETHQNAGAPSPDNTPVSTIKLPTFEEEVLLCSEAAKKYYDGAITISDALEGGSPYRPFVFEYNLGGKSGRFFLSESPDLSNAAVFSLDEQSKSLTIDNLIPATHYYYAVETDGETYTGEFQTAESTRFVSMPGVPNTRDIGGYPTLDGKTVRQGMIIRGAEIDGLVEYSYFLDEAAQETVAETFGFVYDMDLRSNDLFSGQYQSRLGDNVRHRFFSAPAYGAIFSAPHKQSVRDMFAALADERNYPMYLHCTYGADRTGTLVFLLQGVLNMSEDDMMMDYRLTGFFKPGYAGIDCMDPLITGLQTYKGDTLQEKIEDFLVNDVRVPQEDIQSIRSILLEP